MAETVGNIYREMCDIAPLEFAVQGDNVGLLTGNKDDAVQKVLISLDITMPVLEEAAEKSAGLVISHHSLLRNPLKKATDDSPDGRKVLFAIRNGIAVISMHTNLDAADNGVNDMLAKAVGLENIEYMLCADTAPGVPPLARGGTVPECSLEEYIKRVASGLKISNLRYIDGGRPVHRVAVGSGNSSDTWETAYEQGYDTYVSGDFRYSQFTAAAELGMNIIDGGHFPTENVICGPLCKTLSERIKGAEFFVSKKHCDCIKFYNGE